MPPLMPFAPRSEFDPRALTPPGSPCNAWLTLVCRPPMGFVHPSTLPEAGSDLHRAWHPRLCGAFRFSQPLDASFRPQPLRPCLMPVTPLGFDLQRFSPPGSREPLGSTAPPAVPPSTRAFRRSFRRRPDDRGSRGSSIREIRSPRCRCYPRTVTPILSWHFPLRGTSPRTSAPCFHDASSHGLSHRPERRTAPIALALQSLKDPRPGRLSRDEPTSLGFPSAPPVA
jgi:hypothetical protein